uniref:Uncharacterized protein n=1 Tax=Brassica oleracea var. oleracea TaxID=109376 RepID=A0A0D2ZQ88_BRAOL
MVKTKFTRNGREVMIFRAKRNFDYGSDEAVQESKKGGERDASRRRRQGGELHMGCLRHLRRRPRSGELHMGSHLRRRPRGVPSPEKATRRGSTLSPRVAKKQSVNVAPSGDDREEWPETEMLASTVAKKTRRGTSYGGSPVSPRQSKKQKVKSEKSLGDDGDDREEFLQIVVNEEEEFGYIGDDGREDENVLRPHPHCSGIPRIPIVFTDESSQPELIMRYSKKER